MPTLRERGCGAGAVRGAGSAGAEGAGSALRHCQGAGSPDSPGPVRPQSEEHRRYGAERSGTGELVRGWAVLGTGGNRGCGAGELRAGGSAALFFCWGLGVPPSTEPCTSGAVLFPSLGRHLILPGDSWGAHAAVPPPCAGTVTSGRWSAAARRPKPLAGRGEAALAGGSSPAGSSRVGFPVGELWLQPLAPFPLSSTEEQESKPSSARRGVLEGTGCAGEDGQPRSCCAIAGSHLRWERFAVLRVRQPLLPWLGMGCTPLGRASLRISLAQSRGSQCEIFI